MSKFVELFQKYGYKIEVIKMDGLTDSNSFIADNGIFCIPFTEIKCGQFCQISAMSFSSYDHKKIKEKYKGVDIGCAIFADWMNRHLIFLPIGGLANHDYDLQEIESWLNDTQIVI